MAYLARRGTTPNNEEYLKQLGYKNIASCKSSVSVWNNPLFAGTMFYEIEVAPGCRVNDFKSFVEKVTRDAYLQGQREESNEIKKELSSRAAKFIESL